MAKHKPPTEIGRILTERRRSHAADWRKPTDRYNTERQAVEEASDGKHEPEESTSQVPGWSPCEGQRSLAEMEQEHERPGPA